MGLLQNLGLIYFIFAKSEWGGLAWQRGQFPGVVCSLLSSLLLASNSCDWCFQACLPCATFGSLREGRRGYWGCSASWGPWGGKLYPTFSLLFHPMKKEETDRHFSPGKKEYLCEEARNVLLLTVHVTSVVTWSWFSFNFFPPPHSWRDLLWQIHWIHL